MGAPNRLCLSLGWPGADSDRLSDWRFTGACRGGCSLLHPWMVQLQRPVHAGSRV